MKLNIQGPICLIAILFVLMIGVPLVYADSAPTATVTVAVCVDVHSGGDLENLYDEFNQLMDQYAKEVSPEKKKQILQKAKNIFKQLMEQADNVEAEVSKKSEQKLDKAYARQLDSVLKRVKEIRRLAQEKMDSAVKTG